MTIQIPDVQIVVENNVAPRAGFFIPTPTILIQNHTPVPEGFADEVLTEPLDVGSRLLVLMRGGSE